MEEHWLHRAARELAETEERVRKQTEEANAKDLAYIKARQAEESAARDPEYPDLGPVSTGYGTGSPGADVIGFIVGALVPIAMIGGIIAMFVILGDGAEDTDAARSATAGALRIQKCGDLYKYYDRAFLQEQVGTSVAWPTGYTYSRTPPGANLAYIVEDSTFLVRGLGAGSMVSQGRSIPRHAVTPVEHTPGNYMIIGGQRVSCGNVYYRPPGSAGDAEREAAQASF